MNSPYQSPFNKARKDKFLVVITIPKALKGIDTNNPLQRSQNTINSDSFSFSVYGINLPEISIDHNALRYAGQNVSISSLARPYHGDLKINFTVDNYWNNYWFLFNWLNILNNAELSIVDPSKPVGILNLTLYQTTITLFMLDEYNNPVINFEFTDAFPIKLDGVDMNNRDEAEAECVATFAFSQYIPNLLDIGQYSLN